MLYIDLLCLLIGVLFCMLSLLVFVSCFLCVLGVVRLLYWCVAFGVRLSCVGVSCVSCVLCVLCGFCLCFVVCCKLVVV